MSQPVNDTPLLPPPSNSSSAAKPAQPPDALARLEARRNTRKAAATTRRTLATAPAKEAPRLSRETPATPAASVESKPVTRPDADKNPAPAPAATTEPAVEAAPAAPVADEVMATVNGEPILMSVLHRNLVRDYGMQEAQQLIANELVRQQAAKEKISVSDSDVKAMHDRTLEQMFPSMPAAQRDSLLEQLLTQNRISRGQWDSIMRRNALLAKLAEPKIRITEQDLQEAFGDAYGQKFVVRHIQTVSLAEAQRLRKELISTKADFADAARKYSTNPSAADGGLLPPISKDSKGVPPAIQQAAMAMKKVGEISEPVLAGTAYHLLYLEQIVPPQDVKFQDVKTKLEKNLRSRQIRILQQEMLAKMIREATEKGDIQYVNPVLKEQAEKASLNVAPIQP
jgi:parvulin-like peptidyl-prolyl isomerase